MKLKNYQNALEYIHNAQELITKIYTQQSKEYALSNVIKSEILTESKELSKGIEAIKKSICKSILM